MKKWLQKYLGINHELEEQRYKVIELGLKEINQKYVVADLEIKDINTRLTELNKAIEYLTEINTKLAEAANKLSHIKEGFEYQIKLQSDEIATIKEGFEYQTKEIWLIKKQIDSKAKEPASKPKK